MLRGATRGRFGNLPHLKSLPLIRPSRSFCPGGGPEATELGRLSSPINPARVADFVVAATNDVPNLSCDRPLVLRQFLTFW